MKVKDKLSSSMHSSCIVYCVPCSCGELYIRETVRRLEMRIKETTVINQARRQIELCLKEALHIHLTPEDQGHRDRSS